LQFGIRTHTGLRDTENADIPIMAPGFGSDFVELIEQNRRRSIATSRILQLRHGEIWPEDGMLKRDIGVFRVPKSTEDENAEAHEGAQAPEAR